MKEVIYPYRIYVYSLPICHTNFRSYSVSKNIVSTSPDFIFNHHVHDLHLTVKPQTTIDYFNEIFTSFQKRTKLNICCSHMVLKQFVKVMQNYISISNLKDIELKCSFLSKDGYDFNLRLNEIFTILPRQIKYLQIYVNNIERISLILERCSNLAVLKLYVSEKKCLIRLKIGSNRKLEVHFWKNIIHF